MNKIITILLTLTAMVSLAMPAQVLAQSTNAKAVCEGVGLIGGSKSCSKTGSEKKLGDIVKTGIRIISVVVGVISVIMIIVGGLKYITSGGDASNTASAKNTILYAIVGLVIVALAQIIVRYVLSNVPQ